MKKILLILCALLLTALGASADVNYTWALSGGTWTVSQGNGSANAHPGFSSSVTETWSGSDYTAGDVISKTITGLPEGTYTLVFYAAANKDSGTSDVYGTSAATVYANESSHTIDVYSYNNASYVTNGGWFDVNLQTFENVTVGTEGTLTFGLSASGTNSGTWYLMEAVSLIQITNETMTLEPGDVVEDEGDEDNQSHWTQTFTGTGTNGALGYNTWSGESGMTTPYHQVHVSAGSSTSPVSLSDQTIDHYQFMGLPAGYYAVTVDARVLSELDNTLSTGSAYFIANNDKVDIVELADVNEDFTYGTATESEASGSYDIIAEVTETDGTLDIGFSITNANYNWFSWKNLKVEYIGTTIEYSLGEPQCSATTVKPGEELTITFEDCITPNTDETPVLASGKSITVNGSTVDAELTTTGLTASVTITIPETIGLGETVTVVVPQGLLTWEKSSPAVSSPTSDVTFTLSTPGMEDQIGVYLYNVHADQFLSRGGETSSDPTTYGEIAATDVYGIPLDITFGDDGFATVKFLDSNNYLYLEGWAYTDGTEAQAAKYEVRTVTTTDGETVYQFCYNGNDEYLYVNDETNNYVASNGNLGDNGGDNNMNSQPERGYWQIFTADQRNAHKAARELNDHIAIAAADGGEVTSEAEFEAYLESIGATTDMTDMVANAELTSLTGWTSTTYSGSSINTGTYGTEFYVTDAKISQTVTGLEQGIYKVTMQGFVRQGSSSNIISNNLGVYDLSIGFIEANGYQTNIMPWAEDREKMSSETGYSDAYPDNTTQAAACFTAGLYNNELYTYVDEDGSLELSINCPDALGSGWMIVYNLTLTYYGEIVELDYANDVTWKLANPSFEVDNVVANLTEDETRTAYKVTSLTGWTLTPPNNTDSARPVSDLMTSSASETDNDYGVPGTPSDGTYMLYLRNSWTSGTETASVLQSVTLPEGDYKLTVDTKCVSSGSYTSALLVAGDHSVNLTVHDKQSTTKEDPFLDAWDTPSITFTSDGETEITLGVTIAYANVTAGLSVLLDNFKLYSAEEIEESISWEMTEAGWGTMILPFDATLEEGLTAYSCSGTEESEDEEGNEITVVSLTEVGQSITANTPYIIKCTDDSAIKAHSFTGIPTNTVETYTEGILTGTLVDLAIEKGAALTINGTNYVLQNHTADDEGYQEGDEVGLAFYPITSESTGVTLDACHCYLTLDNSTSPDGVRAFISLPGSENEETGIVAVESEALANDAIYDLSGRRVAKAVKGVYIQNGKKVLVK